MELLFSSIQVFAFVDPASATALLFAALSGVAGVSSGFRTRCKKMLFDKGKDSPGKNSKKKI